MKKLFPNSRDGVKNGLTFWRDIHIRQDFLKHLSVNKPMASRHRED